MEISDAYAALGTQLQKTFKALSPKDAVALAGGQAKIVVVAEGQRLIQDQPGLDSVLKALATLPAQDAQTVAGLVARAIKALTTDDLVRVAGGGSSLKVAHKGGRVTYPVDAAQIARDVSDLTSEDGIIKLLDADDRLKPTDLRKIGDQLGVRFPAGVKQRDAMIAHIARSAASF